MVLAWRLVTRCQRSPRPKWQVAMRVLHQFNQRYLIVDFKKEQFFYSHTSDLKKVSQPIYFNELLSVCAISSPEAGHSIMGMKEKVNQKFAKGEGYIYSTENGICVQTRQRELEFYFNSNSTDANMWLQ